MIILTAVRISHLPLTLKSYHLINQDISVVICDSLFDIRILLSLFFQENNIPNGERRAGARHCY